MNSYSWTILMGFLVNLIVISGIDGRPASNLGGCESTYCAGLRDICKNDGKCVEDPTNRCQGKCQCSKRYSGPYCEVDKSSLPITLAPDRQRQSRPYGNIMSFFASLSRKSSKSAKSTTTTTTKAPVTTLESELNDNKNDKQEQSVASINSNGKEEDTEGYKNNTTSESEANDNSNDKPDNIAPNINSNGKEEDNDGNKNETTSSEKKRDTIESKDTEKSSYLKRTINKETGSSTNATNTNDNSKEDSVEVMQNNTSSEEDIDAKGERDVVATDLELTLESFRNLLQADSLFSDGFGLPELQDNPVNTGSNGGGVLGDLGTVVSAQPINGLGTGATVRKTQSTESPRDNNAPSDVISQRMSSLSSVHGSAHDHVFSDLSQLIDVPNSKPISTFKPIVLTTVSPLEMLLSNVMLKGAEPQRNSNNNKRKAKQNSSTASNGLGFPDIETLISSKPAEPVQKKTNVTENLHVEKEVIQVKNKTTEHKSSVKTEIVSNKENVSFSLSDGLNSDVNLIQNVPNITNVSKTNDLGSLLNKSQIVTEINTPVKSSLFKEETAVPRAENTKGNENDNAIISELQKVTTSTSDLELKRNMTNDKNVNESNSDENLVSSHGNTVENKANVSAGVKTTLKDSLIVPQSDSGSKNYSSNGTTLSKASIETTTEPSGQLSKEITSLVPGKKMKNATKSDSNKTSTDGKTTPGVIITTEASSGHLLGAKKNHKNTTHSNLNRTSSIDNIKVATQIIDSANKVMALTTGSGSNGTKQNATKSINNEVASELIEGQIETVKSDVTNININNSAQSVKNKTESGNMKGNSSSDSNVSKASNETVVKESSNVSPNVSETVIQENGNHKDAFNVSVVQENKKNKTDGGINKAVVVEIGLTNKTMNKDNASFSNQDLDKNISRTNISRSTTTTTTTTPTPPPTTTTPPIPPPPPPPPPPQPTTTTTTTTTISSTPPTTTTPPTTKTTENNMSEQHTDKQNVKELSEVFDPLTNNNENYNTNAGIDPAMASDSVAEFASVNVKSSDVKFSALKAVSRELATKDGDNTIENRNARKNRLNEKSHFIDEVEAVSPKERLALKGNGDMFVTDSDVYGQTGGRQANQESIVTSSNIGEQTESTTTTTTTTTRTPTSTTPTTPTPTTTTTTTTLTTTPTTKITTTSDSVVNKQLMSNDSITQPKVVSEAKLENINTSSISTTVSGNDKLSPISGLKPSAHHIINSIVNSDNNVPASEITETNLLKIETTNGHKPDLPKVTEANIVLPSSDMENTELEPLLDIVEKTTKTPILESEHGLNLTTVTEANIVLSSNTEKRNESQKDVSEVNGVKETPKTSSELSEKAVHGNGLDLRVTESNLAMPSSDITNVSVSTKVTSNRTDNAKKHNKASDHIEETVRVQNSKEGVKVPTTTESAKTVKDNGTSMTPKPDYGSANDIANVSHFTSSGNNVDGNMSALVFNDSKVNINANELSKILTVDKNNNSTEVKTDNITSNETINVQSKESTNGLGEETQSSNHNSSLSNIDKESKTTTHDPTSATVLVESTLPGTHENKTTQLPNIKKPNS